MVKTWKEEKERKLDLSPEEARSEYTCESNYVPLEDILTWKEECVYRAKLSKETVRQTEEETLKLTEQLLKDFTLKEEDSVDLTEYVSVFVGDITRLEIDTIVNAANNSLLGGGGVDGAIHRAAGIMLLAENRTLHGCRDGEAKLSGGYNLPAKYVMSTVGPRGEYPDVLESAYTSCLKLMLKSGLRSIAFPCISTGIYGYPNDAACAVALKAVRAFLEEHHRDVDRVIFCLFLPVDVELYNTYLPLFFPPKSE